MSILYNKLKVGKSQNLLTYFEHKIKKYRNKSSIHINFGYVLIQ